MKALKAFLNALLVSNAKLVIILTIMITGGQVFSQTIATSQGTFVLVPAGDLVDASAARSAKRVAELAIPALTGDVKKLNDQMDNLQERISKYNEESKQYDKDLSAYDVDLDAYNRNLETYETELGQYDRELEPHNAAVDAHNSIAPEERDEATYQRLLDSKNRLDVWLESLNGKKAVLDQELAGLDSRREVLNKAYESLNTRFQPLDDEYNNLNIQLGKAYKQLEALYEYSKQINELLGRWQEPPLDTYNLNTQLEQLKALSNEGWD